MTEWKDVLASRIPEAIAADIDEFENQLELRHAPTDAGPRSCGLRNRIRRPAAFRVSEQLKVRIHRSCLARLIGIPATCCCNVGFARP